MSTLFRVTTTFTALIIDDGFLKIEKGELLMEDVNAFKANANNIKLLVFKEGDLLDRSNTSDVIIDTALAKEYLIVDEW